MAWNEPGPGHDPWNQGSGGKRGDRPPDFNKLLKRLKELLRGGAPGPGKSRGVAGSVLVLLLAIWLGSGFYTIDAQQRGVELRFGVVTGDVGPGLGWHLPWPVGAIEKVNVTKLRQATTQSTLLTKDQNLVDVGLTVQFRVSSVRQYLFDVADPDDTLSQTANSVLRRVVGRYDVDDVLGGSQREIADQVKQKLQQILDGYGCGLHVVDVGLSQVQPPDKVQAAFADAIKAQSDERTMIDSAEAYAKDRLPQARSQATQETASAESYRDQTVSQAKGEAARFDALLDEYRKSPKLTRQRMYIDTMAGILKNSRVVVIDAGKGAATVNLHVVGEAATGASEAATGAPGGTAGGGSSSHGKSSSSGADQGGDQGRGDQSGSGARSRDRGGAR